MTPTNKLREALWADIETYVNDGGIEMRVRGMSNYIDDVQTKKAFLKGLKSLIAAHSAPAPRPMNSMEKRIAYQKGYHAPTAPAAPLNQPSAEVLEAATNIRKLVFDWIQLEQRDMPWPTLDGKLALALDAFAASHQSDMAGLRERITQTIREHNQVTVADGETVDAVETTNEIMSVIAAYFGVKEEK